MAADKGTRTGEACCGMVCGEGITIPVSSGRSVRTADGSDGRVDSAGKSDGYVFEEIAECLLSLERGEEAAPYFGKAYEVLSLDEWLAANEPARLARLMKLSRE